MTWSRCCAAVCFLSWPVLAYNDVEYPFMFVVAGCFFLLSEVKDGSDKNIG